MREEVDSWSVIFNFTVGGMYKRAVSESNFGSILDARNASAPWHDFLGNNAIECRLNMDHVTHIEFEKILFLIR